MSSKAINPLDIHANSLLATIYDHPRQVLADEILEPVQKRCILAAWASDAFAVEDKRWLRQIPGSRGPILLSEILDALRCLDDDDGDPPPTGLATELQRMQRGDALYVLDEPTTGLHPSDVARLMTQLDGLVTAGNSVVVVEHDMSVVAESDWVIDIGPGAGDEGGTIVAVGPPETVSAAAGSRTATYLASALFRSKIHHELQ